MFLLLRSQLLSDIQISNQFYIQTVWKSLSLPMVIIWIVSDEIKPIILKPTATDCAEIARPSLEIYMYYMKLILSICQIGLWQTTLAQSV